jgi:hypothetical protein
MIWTIPPKLVKDSNKLLQNIIYVCLLGIFMVRVPFLDIRLKDFIVVIYPTTHGIELIVKVLIIHMVVVIFHMHM